MRLIIILLFFILVTSCAKTNSEKVNEAIDVALTYLSSEECDKAIDVLEEAGRDKTNAIYLQVLASAYACRAGYSEVDFLITDIPNIESAAADLMKSLTKLTLSPETQADSSEYVDLREALEIVLYVDSSQPSQTKREAKYGIRKAGDMGVQALFLSLVQLGKFLHFYGNVDATGGKGLGTANTDEQGATPSTCFIEYTYPAALTYLTTAGGVCDNMATDDGHPNLSLAAGSLTATKTKLCEGLMLVTNIIDILGNITLPAGSAYGDLTTVSTTVDTFKSVITTADPSLSTLMNTTSQEVCETLVAGSTEFDNLQYIYALLFETGLP